jgi:hypothetical protein
MLDSILYRDVDRGVLDYVALGAIVLVVLAAALLALGGLLAPFIVASSYAHAAFVPAIVVALIGGLLGVYLAMTGMTLRRDRHGIALTILLAILGYVAVAYGVPATLGSFSPDRETLTFTVTSGRISGSRGSCAGVYVHRDGYEDKKLCGSYGPPGSHVEVSGRMSAFGILYAKTRAAP